MVSLDLPSLVPPKICAEGLQGAFSLLDFDKCDECAICFKFEKSTTIKRSALIQVLSATEAFVKVKNWEKMPKDFDKLLIRTANLLGHS